MANPADAITFIRNLLAGGSPNGTPSTAFGEWRDLMEVL